MTALDDGDPEVQHEAFDALRGRGDEALGELGDHFPHDPLDDVVAERGEGGRHLGIDPTRASGLLDPLEHPWRR